MSTMAATPGWDDLSLANMERALRQDRFVDAVVLSVRLILGVEPLVLSVGYGSVAVRAVVGGDVFYGATFAVIPAEWPTPDTGPEGEFMSEGWDRRLLTLRRALGRLFMRSDSLTDSLRVGSWPAPTHPLLLLHVRAWLAERLAEGHSPESARMLLGLTMSGESWALVDVDPCGGVRLARHVPQ